MPCGKIVGLRLNDGFPVGRTEIRCNAESSADGLSNKGARMLNCVADSVNF